MREAGKIPPQPWLTSADTRAVVAALTARGAEVRFVGGCVRDAVIGRPVKDVDIATHDPPETVMELLESAGLRAVPTGIAHGTVTAVVGAAHFEVTTLRRDVETFGRHARVEYTDDWVADAARRDLTINALFCAPDGTLYDPYDGLDDLHAGRVRFVGEAEDRIREDVLRLLRFFRFFAYYGKPPPDEDAMAACRKLKDLLPTLSAERIWSELRKLLLAPGPAAVLELMDREGILAQVIPEPRQINRLGAIVEIEGEIDDHDSLRRLSALVAVDAAGAEALADRLRLSNAEKRRLVRIAAALPQFMPVADEPGRARWFYRQAPEGGRLYRDTVLLHWAGRRAAGSAITEGEADGYRKAADEAQAWRSPRFPLGGKDVKTLGIGAGPRVGDLLEAVEGWWVESNFRPSRQACLERLAALAGEGTAP